TIIPISRSIEFASKFPNEILDKTQLQRFLGCVNYIAEFIPNIRIICAPLYKRLRKNPPKWTNEMTQVIIEIKNLVKKLPCLGIPDPSSELIIEIDASDIGYGGILKQKLPNSSKDSSSTSTGPTIASLRSNYQNPTKSQYSLSQILANPIPRPTNPLVSKNIFIHLYFNTITRPKSEPIITAHELSNDPYVEKPKLLPIMTLESYMIKEDLKTLIAHIFPKNFNYLPNNQLKTQIFYEFILVDTDSAEITHTEDDQGSVLFSEMKVINILSPQDSNQYLFDSKTFSRQFNPPGYTYYDYIDAWFNTFYINPKKHSWFIWFKKGIPLKFSKWFVKWFYNFRLLREIFPQNVKEVYDYFKETSTFVPGYRIISFVASQSITWILVWEYVIIPQYEEEIIDMKLLARKVKVKWWKKFNTEIINKTKISKRLKNNKAKKGLPPKLELNKESLFLLEKQRLMAELATSTTVEEFYSKAKSLQRGSSKNESDEGSSQSNPYLPNEDMFD
ncbi:Orf V, partial [Mucuna pruriens]